MDFSDATISPGRFYTLLEAQSLAGIPPMDLVRLAGAAMINLCVPIPAGRRAFSVDPASVITWDANAQLERDVFRAFPDQQRGVPERKDEVMALVLDPYQCHQLEDHGISRQVFFRSAYLINGERTFGMPARLLRVRPLRLPLFSADGKTPTDQSRWRFSVYPIATTFQYFEGYGYCEPEDVRINPDAILVAGCELLRLPKPIDLSARDVEEMVGGNVVSDDGGETQVYEAEGQVSSHSVTNDLFDEIKDTVASDLQDCVESSVIVDSCHSSEVIPESKEPLAVLTREEVERLIKKGKSWIYERINQKHPRYDPTFPKPIDIGSNKFWISTEVQEWWQKQIRSGIVETRGS